MLISNVKNNESDLKELWQFILTNIIATLLDIDKVNKLVLKKRINAMACQMSEHLSSLTGMHSTITLITVLFFILRAYTNRNYYPF